MPNLVARLAAKAFAENHIASLSADIASWRTSKEGVLPESPLLHELAAKCALYVSDDSEYQEAERLIGLKALEAVSQLKPLQEQVTHLKRLLERLHPHVRGCDPSLWDEYHAALSASSDPVCSAQSN